jgi:hypothetical protein
MGFDTSLSVLFAGGSWDNSDVSKAKKKQWSTTDKKYVANEAPVRPDWLGTVNRKKGPGQQRAAAKVEKAAPQKKLFGLF